MSFDHDKEVESIMDSLSKFHYTSSEKREIAKEVIRDKFGSDSVPDFGYHRETESYYKDKHGH
ncbi:MAG: hypothetical protein ABIC91_08575 [Nanoarchaeota archaeon]|nr:hypothetical protein [Nanoarchaeota archaeon]MBU1030310.1 hypothetical protein [Nanoarchaeota archaeon]MBU1849323.1 hypothetical protein [Nanoarchaeota archaeon]